MNTRSLVVFLFAVFLLCSGITAIVYSSIIVVDVRSIYAEASI